MDVSCAATASAETLLAAPECNMWNGMPRGTRSRHARRCGALLAALSTHMLPAWEVQDAAETQRVALCSRGCGQGCASQAARTSARASPGAAMSAAPSTTRRRCMPQQRSGRRVAQCGDPCAWRSAEQRIVRPRTARLLLYPAMHHAWRTMLLPAAAVESGGETCACDAAVRLLACRCLRGPPGPGRQHGNLRLGCGAWDAAKFSAEGVGSLPPRTRDR